MESTNQELGHDNLIAVQQRQQQELIKLLAQHFHNQFYQLACNNQSTNRGPSNNGANQFCSGSPTTSSSPNCAAATTRSSPINLNTYPTAAGAGQSPGDPAALVSANRGLDLSCLNLLAATTGGTNHLQLLQEQQVMAARSHQGNSVAANQQLPSLADFPNTSGNMISPYQFNIINALGLHDGNDESNRLALSLRQQSLVQAIRQQQNHQESSSMRTGDCIFGQEIHDHHRQQQQQQRNLENRNHKTNDGYPHDDTDGEQALGGKSSLKFSINTILGRNSPQSYTQTDCETTDQINNRASSGSENLSPICNNQTGTRQTYPAGASEVPNIDRKRASIIEGDASDSNSETDSLPTSTPVPQIDRHSSILLNQPVTNHGLRDGNSYATTTPSANSGAAVNNLVARNHHQQSLRHVPQAHLGGPHSLAPFLGNSSSFPWTVTSRGKPRRGMMRRAVFSDSQRVGLEKRFQMQKYISKPDRKKLAEKLGLRDSQVKIWFQNRRMKWRNSKERELLSAGGSREQTLPTRNNPNPDLSDVGETIRRLTSTSNASGATTS